MKNAQSYTNAEPSALVQRDISPYRGAIQILSHHALSAQCYPPSRSAVVQRFSANRFPHSLHSVGDGLHVIPITREGLIVGYPAGINPEQVDLWKFRRLWLPEWGIDRRYLILDSFLWVDIQELLDRPPLARKVFAWRAARALKPVGFPALRGIHRQADLLIRAELAAKLKGVV
jgi:hypothetical protein